MYPISALMETQKMCTVSDDSNENVKKGAAVFELASAFGLPFF